VTRCAVVPLAGLLIGVGPAQKPSVFEARVESVYVDVFVSDHGSPVEGLQAANFEVRDDGRLQTVELMGHGGAPLRIVLVLDRSDSVRGEKLAALKAAGHAFLLGLHPEDRTTLLTFSQEVRRHGAPGGDPRSLDQELDTIDGAGSTSVFDALFAAFLTIGAVDRGLIVLFSDGEDNFSWLRADEVRRVAERSNALLEVVAVRGGPGAGEYQGILRTLAGATGGRVWEAEAASRLDEAFAHVLEAMRTRYVLRFEPAGVKGAGEHHLRVSLKGARGDVSCRTSYFRSTSP
jgi:VWFA-related protein